MTKAIRQSLVAIAFGVFVDCHAAVAATEYLVRASVDCLNVRSDPNTDAPVVACLPPGVKVRVLDSVPYWRRVRLRDGREGWAAKAFLELSSASAGEAESPLPHDQWLEVHFVDVGQGDAIWIHTPDDGIDGNGIYEGRNVVIDGGPNSSDDKNALLAYLEKRAHHLAVVDALIVSHAHTDHFRGAETISRHFEIDHYYDPGYPSELKSYAAFLGAMQGESGDTPRARQLHLGADTFGTLSWGSEIEADFLYGWNQSRPGLGSGNTKVNNSSIVLRLQYDKRVFLFMGDAEGKDREDPPDTPKYVESILLEEVPAERLRASVLKVGHHGSETSSSNDFIAAVSPEVVVVQSGRKAFNGRFIPDATTLRRFCCHDSATRIFRTDQGDQAAGLSESKAADGDHIVVRTNGVVLEVQAWEGGESLRVESCSPSCGD